MSHLPDNAHGSLFLEKTYDLLLKQHISASTRFRDRCQPSLLDLLFTNEEFMIDNLTYNPPIVNVTL